MMAIWRQSVIKKRAGGSLGLTWFLLAMFLLGTFTLHIGGPQRNLLFAFFTGVPMGMLVVMWWTFLLGSVGVQCHPAALQLVPQLRQRVQRTVVLAWLAGVAVMTLLVGVPTGYPAQVAIVTALVLSEMSFIGSARGMFLAFLLLALPNASHDIMAWVRWAAVTPATLAIGAVLAVLDGGSALRRLGRVGGVAGMAPVRPTIGNQIQARLRMARPGGRKAAWYERGADPQPAFLHPLGRSWYGGHLDLLCCVALVCMVLRGIAAVRVQADLHAALAGARVLLALGMLGMLAVTVYMEAQRFARAVPEQALLVLTPAAPAALHMNAMLARRLAAGFARSWTVLAVATLAALFVLGAAPGELARVAAAWAMALPLVAIPMRDFARARTPVQWPWALLLAGMAGCGALASNGAGRAKLWWLLAGAGALAGLAGAWWRWQVMQSAAPALPAERA